MPSEHVSGTRAIDPCTIDGDDTADLGQAKGRIARLALVLHDLLAVRGRVNGGAFPFHLRQEHIADALGLTKVHVSRTLQGLRHEGVLEIDRQTATILIFRGLRELTDYSETPAQERY